MTAEFEQLIKQLGEAVLRRVESALPREEWLNACLDVRFDRLGTSWLSKIRVVMPDGETKPVKMANEIDLVLISLGAQRGSGGKQWYGLLLTVERDRQCKIKLNYDENCAEDESFFKT
jgi:hypothetical protein